MKTYIVYDNQGHEVGKVKAASHNAAEYKAQKQYGKNVTVEYTEE